jgi:hypothetical protein
MNLVEFVRSLKAIKKDLEKRKLGEIVLDSHFLGFNQCSLTEGVSLCFRAYYGRYSREIIIREKLESENCKKYLDKLIKFIEVSELRMKKRKRR